MRKTLIIALLAGTMFCAPVPARAEPISTAIGLTALIGGALGGSAAALTAGGLIGGALIGGAVSVGISLIANLLTPKAANTAATSSGNDLQTTYGGDVPRAALFGLTATAGQLVYGNVYGTDNTILQAVYVVGDGLHDSLNRIWYNGKLCTIEAFTDGTTGEMIAGQPLTEFRDSNGRPHVFVRFFNGDFDQAADAELVTHANPTGRWTTAHRGRGVSYVSITQGFSDELSLTGYPQVLFEMKGLRLYDLRKDTTAGGSGAHRWGTLSTYEWSDNPSVEEYNFRRGVTINGQLVLGMGVSAADLIKPMYVAAANAPTRTCR